MNRNLAPKVGVQAAPAVAGSRHRIPSLDPVIGSRHRIPSSDRTVRIPLSARFCSCEAMVPNPRVTRIDQQALALAQQIRSRRQRGFVPDLFACQIKETNMAGSIIWWKWLCVHACTCTCRCHVRVDMDMGMRVGLHVRLRVHVHVCHTWEQPLLQAGGIARREWNAARNVSHTAGGRAEQGGAHSQRQHHGKGAAQTEQSREVRREPEAAPWEGCSTDRAEQGGAQAARGSTMGRRTRQPFLTRYGQEARIRLPV